MPKVRLMVHTVVWFLHRNTAGGTEVSICIHLIVMSFILTWLEFTVHTYTAYWSLIYNGQYCKCTTFSNIYMGISGFTKTCLVCTEAVVLECILGSQASVLLPPVVSDSSSSSSSRPALARRIRQNEAVTDCLHRLDAQDGTNERARDDERTKAESVCASLRYCR